MSYHLGTATFVNFPVYGWWMISDRGTQTQLAAVGIQLSDIPRATEMIASKSAPVFVQIVDRGSVLAVSYKYTGGRSSGDTEGYNISQGIEALREKLSRPSKVMTFRDDEVNARTQQPSRTSRGSLDTSGPSTTENAPGASPNTAVPTELPPVIGGRSRWIPETPSTAPPASTDPGAAPANPAGPVASKLVKSNTGLYIGLGAGALLLMVGLGFWSKSR